MRWRSPEHGMDVVQKERCSATTPCRKRACNVEQTGVCVQRLLPLFALHGRLLHSWCIAFEDTRRPLMQKIQAHGNALREQARADRSNAGGCH